jgi:SAM-dependent methyltransferase
MPHYVFDQGYSQEFARLQLLEQYTDEMSQRALLAATPLLGKQVADIGAGAGSMVRWLADQVGPDGTVDAIDIDPRHCRSGLPANAWVVQRDCNTLEPVPRYHAVHCRFLLQHLPDAACTLRVIREALHDGGALVAADSDHTTWHIDADFPFARRAQTAYLRVAENAGWNLTLGRDTADLMRATGFARISAAGYVHYVRGGDLICRFLAASFHALTAKILATGEVGDADLELTVRALKADPDFYMRYLTVWFTTGYRDSSPSSK